ncbi:MAG: PAS domain S-box protein, partial [Catalinimonas sp.]
MFKRISIGTKITLLVIALVMVAVGGITFMTLRLVEQQAVRALLTTLGTLADLKAQRLDAAFRRTSSDLELLGELPAVHEAFAEASLALEAGAADTLDRALRRLDALVQPMKQSYGFDAVSLLHPDGEVVYHSEADLTPGDYYQDPDGETLQEGQRTTYFSSIFQLGDRSVLIVATPLREGERTAGIVVCRIDMTPIYAVMGDTTGLGSSGETVVGRRYQDQVIVLNPLRHDTQAALRRSVFVGEQNAVPLQEATAGAVGNGPSTDYRGERVLAAWRAVDSTGWGIVVKEDLAEVLAPLSGMRRMIAVLAVLIVLLTALLTVFFSRRLVAPLTTLKATMDLLGRGVLPQSTNKHTRDEIGEMGRAVDQLKLGLRRTADFAHQIGRGDFQADFEPLSQDDTLGLALLDMRDSLQSAEKRDEERNWIIKGEAEVGEILRRHQDIGALGDEIVAFVTQKIGAVQGAFYVLEEDEGDGRAYVRMKASYAYNRKKYLAADFKVGQGLVGQSCIENDVIFRTEIPDDYVTVSSGLIGDKKPECLLIVPLVTNEEVNGALEFAALGKFSPREVKFVQEVSHIIARTLFNIQVNERTRRLLHDAQEMGEELQEQQEILQQNAEEMAATQEELKRTNGRLEHQIEEVNRTQQRMQTLLENASEVITIYEEDGTVRYVSPSVERILGYRADELIGVRDAQYVHEESQAHYEGMYAALLAEPHQPHTVQMQFRRRNGEYVWLEATGKNLLHDPAIQGIVINSRDITERRLAEREARMRGQMQALSENSPDLITRVNQEGTFFYINPVIESYTGHRPDYFLQQTLEQVEIEGSLKEAWRGIIDRVHDEQQKVKDEIGFQSEMGDRVMQVNAIPEWNEEQQMESILLVSHDITERKLIELEVQSKNKKITESINYAKRIQTA